MDGPPNVFHWSHAEASTLETAFNSAVNRHPEKTWASPHWYDLLNRVVKKEPVVVRGALNFGLKSVARALHSHGLDRHSHGTRESPTAWGRWRARGTAPKRPPAEAARCRIRS